MDGTQAAQAVIDDLPEPRRSQMQHLHDLILETLPGIDVRVTEYSGSLIGYGWYAYSNSKGPAGEWFTVGDRQPEGVHLAVLDGRARWPTPRRGHEPTASRA